MRRTRSEVADRQAPLRRVFAEDHDAAISVKRVRTTETTSTDVWHGTVTSLDHDDRAWSYGIDDTVGGFDDLPNPGHLLCAALASCLDSTTRMIADHLGVGIEHLEVEVVGDVDVRGCLGVDSSVRTGFRQLRSEIWFQPVPGVDERLVRKVLERAEHLCVTLDTIRNGVPVSVVTRVDAPAALPT